MSGWIFKLASTTKKKVLDIVCRIIWQLSNVASFLRAVGNVVLKKVLLKVLRLNNDKVLFLRLIQVILAYESVLLDIVLKM